jgi:Zn-finger protein
VITVKIIEDFDSVFTDECPMCFAENYPMAVSGFGKVKGYHFNCRDCGWWWRNTFKEETNA